MQRICLQKQHSTWIEDLQHQSQDNSDNMPQKHYDELNRVNTYPSEPSMNESELFTGSYRHEEVMKMI